MKLSIRLISMICALIGATLLTSCSQGANEHQGQQTDQPRKLSIEFQTAPASKAPGKTVSLISTVKEGNQAVNDAKVEFEVWKKGQKEHQKIGAKREGDGVYTASSSFREEGQYLTIVHVTTSREHKMVSGSFVVGQADQAHSHGDDSHHGEGVELHIQLPQQAMSGETIVATGHIQQEGNPLTDARVRFEYWKDGESKHEWTDTEEREPGKYQASIRFPEPGTYHLKLHVEKGKIHDHKEEALVIK